MRSRLYAPTCLGKHALWSSLKTRTTSPATCGARLCCRHMCNVILRSSTASLDAGPPRTVWCMQHAFIGLLRGNQLQEGGLAIAAVIADTVGGSAASHGSKEVTEKCLKALLLLSADGVTHEVRDQPGIHRFCALTASTMCCVDSLGMCACGESSNPNVHGDAPLGGRQRCVAGCWQRRRISSRCT